MLTAAIISCANGSNTINLINSILSLTGREIQILNFEFFETFTSEETAEYISNISKRDIDILIFKIDIDNINLNIFKAINFDIVIYENKRYFNSDSHKQMIKESLSSLNKNSIVIANLDDEEMNDFLTKLKNHIITYGFSSKASITASSIREDILKEDFMLSLQKTILTQTGEKIEPQEYLIRMRYHETDPYSILAAASFAIANGVDLNQLDLI